MEYGRYIGVHQEIDLIINILEENGALSWTSFYEKVNRYRISKKRARYILFILRDHGIAKLNNRKVYFNGYSIKEKAIRDI